MDLIRNAFGGSTSAMSGNAVPLIQEHRSEGSVRGPNISMNLPSDEAADLSPSPNSHQSVAEDTNQDQNAENDEPPPLASDTEWSTDEEDSDGSMPTLQTVSDSSDLDSDVSDSEEESDWGGGEHDSDRDVAHSEEEWEDENEDVPEEWRIIMDEAFSMALNREGRIAGADSRPFRPMRPQDLVDLLLSPLRQSADNDPARAQTLMAGLEVIPEELVRRYEKLRCGSRDDSDGCAICRDEFIEELPVDGRSEVAAKEVVRLFSALPFHPPPNIVLAFPCPGKHLFHNACLAPWLARKTTCPTCRFDIDPDSLTLRKSSPLRASSRQHSQPERIWEPPRGSSLREWLEEEERVREDGADSKREVKVANPAVQEVGKNVPSGNLADGQRGYDGEDDERDWIDTDSDHSDVEEGASTEMAVIAPLPVPQVLEGQLLPDTPSTLPERLATPWPLSGVHARRLRSLLATNSNSHFPSMDLHDAVLEDMLTRALRMGRSSLMGSYPAPRLRAGGEGGHGRPGESPSSRTS
ncbi:hypothetical protein AcW2_007307 [Taiwanofungus camphoratus]|nr:hypothetical protein AcW2_007307 [Antrodia cinnamomea]